MTADHRIWRLPQHDWCKPLPVEPAVQVGDRLFIAGQVASSMSGGEAAPEGIEGQAVAAFGADTEYRRTGRRLDGRPRQRHVFH